MKKQDGNFIYMILIIGLMLGFSNACKKSDSTTTTTKKTGTVTDIDGNVYHTVTIGNQVWTVENLKTTRYNDGTAIPLVTEDTAWASLKTPGYCWYDNDEGTYKSTYGALYNWYTVTSGKLCPAGWHIPTDAEWATLVTFLGDSTSAGGKLKETGTEHWAAPNTGATNKTGFNGLPGGDRSYTGAFHYMRTYGCWWCTTEYSTTDAWEHVLSANSTNVIRMEYSKGLGLSVRCIKD